MENQAFDFESENNFNTFKETRKDEGRGTSKEDEKVSLKKNIGFTSCVGIIIGTVIGSGIFISPIGVLLESGSVGLTLIIWALCGFFSFMGALSFTELATLLPSSGGQYIYLLEGFAPNRKSERLFWGPLLAFLFSMEETFFSRPASSAVQALSISTYLLNLGKLGCASGSSENEVVQIKLMASCFVVVITTINCYSVKFSTGVINVFTALKLVALFVIITGGVLTLSSGETGALKTGFQDTNLSFSSLAAAFYSGLWAYGGWDNITLVGREIKDPEKNLSKAMLTSFIVITTVYLATNISYFALMSKEEFIASDAVAVDYGTKLLGYFGGVYIVFSVAFSIFGSTTGGSFTGARVAYASAREGHLVDILSFLNVRYSTPSTAMIFTCILSLFMITQSNILSLMFLSGFMNSIFMAMSMILVFVFRKTKRDQERIKVNLIAPALAFVFFLLLIVTPFFENPKLEYVYCLIFLFAGFIIYIPFVYYKWRPPGLDTVKRKIQLILEVVPPEDHEI